MGLDRGERSCKASNRSVIKINPLPGDSGPVSTGVEYDPADSLFATLPLVLFTMIGAAITVGGFTVRCGCVGPSLGNTVALDQAINLHRFNWRICAVG
jgi:hypothetical protein